MFIPFLSATEAILFAVGSQGLSTTELANVLQVSEEESRTFCLTLQQDYNNRESGLDVLELAGVWQLVTRPEYAVYLKRLATSPTSSSLSSAALEVLAIVAYRQPISRLDIEAIRGVSSERSLGTLVHRQLVHEVGRQEGPGRPILYGTTQTFLGTFGLRQIVDLPPLPEDIDGSSETSLFHWSDSTPRD